MGGEVGESESYLEGEICVGCVVWAWRLRVKQVGKVGRNVKREGELFEGRYMSWLCSVASLSTSISHINHLLRPERRLKRHSQVYFPVHGIEGGSRYHQGH